MTKLDRLNVDSMEQKIESIKDEKYVYNQTLKFYNRMLDDKPNLKYVLTTWIENLVRQIEECDVEIQYWLEEKSDLIERIKNIT